LIFTETVPNSFIIAERSSFYQICRLGQLNPHVSLYKATGVREIRGMNATSETVQKLSLSYQLDQIVTNSEKLKNTKNKP